MSYEIIRGIKVNEQGEVWIKGASNNVTPRDYSWWHCKSLTKYLKEHGRKELDIEILEQYEGGTFQAGLQNRYTRALKVLRYFPEYDRFNWRHGGIGKEYEEINKRRDTQAFENLLHKAMITQLPKDKFIIKKQYVNGICYLWKTTKRYARWVWKRNKAKIFRYKKEAEIIQKCFTNSDNWIIEKVA